MNWEDLEVKNIDKEGTYTLTVKSVVPDDNGNVTQTSVNGTEFHKFLLESEDHETLYMSLYMTDSSLWKYAKFVQACGLETPKTGKIEMEYFRAIPNRLIGKKFVAEVGRCKPKMNVETGVEEPSKYFEVKKFSKI